MNMTLNAERIRTLSGRRGRLEVFDNIDPKKSALLVIDMQRAWTDPAGPWYFPQARTVIPTINALASSMRDAGGSVIWVQHRTGAPGTPDHWSNFFKYFVSESERPGALAAIQEGSPHRELDPELDIQGDDLIVPKTRYSAMVRTSSQLEAILREKDIDTVVIAGVQTNMCVESTARDAMMLDFKVFMPHDASAARTEEDHNSGLFTVAKIFADIRPAAGVTALIEQARR